MHAGIHVLLYKAVYFRVHDVSGDKERRVRREKNTAAKRLKARWVEAKFLSVDDQDKARDESGTTSYVTNTPVVPVNRIENLKIIG